MEMSIREINEIFYWIIVLVFILMAFGVMFRLISLKGFLKWGIILAFGGSMLITVGIPFIQQLQNQYGNLVLFLLICAAISALMLLNDFTRQILAGIFSAIIYNQFLKWLFVFTGAALFLTGLAYTVSKWIMEK